MTDENPTDEGTAGFDRRTMLKRSAIVGGALVWTTPVVQSIGGAAFAQQVSPRVQGCISGQVSDIYFVKIDSAAGALETSPGDCPPDGLLSTDKPGNIAGVSGSFGENSGTITLPAGFSILDADVKVGIGEGNPDSDVDERGCVDDALITVSAPVVNPATCAQTFTITVGSSNSINRGISHINVRFQGCPVPCVVTAP